MDSLIDIRHPRLVSHHNEFFFCSFKKRETREKNKKVYNGNSRVLILICTTKKSTLGHTKLRQKSN